MLIVSKAAGQLMTSFETMPYCTIDFGRFRIGFNFSWFRVISGPIWRRFHEKESKKSTKDVGGQKRDPEGMMMHDVWV